MFILSHSSKKSHELCKSHSCEASAKCKLVRKRFLLRTVIKDVIQDYFRFVVLVFMIHWVNFLYVNS